jgi:hypothetical protein
MMATARGYKREIALFEGHGWDEIYSRNAGGWTKDGLWINRRRDGGWHVCAGSAHGVKRITSFETPSDAILFCERIAALAEWRNAGEWTEATGPDRAALGQAMHQIALEITQTRQ